MRCPRDCEQVGEAIIARRMRFRSVSDLLRVAVNRYVEQEGA